jgi:LacI family transcriptional regulator
MLAVGVLHGARQAGLQVPDDLSVTGFDNVPLASYVLPELTTVAQPITQILYISTNTATLRGADVAYRYYCYPPALETCPCA